MARVIKGLSVMLLCSVMASGEVIDADTWANLINLAGRQRMLSQKMAKEFLQVAKGVSPEDSRRNLTSTVKLFDDTLSNLMSGTAEGYAPPPSDLVEEGLLIVEGHWGSYKAVLETNMATISPSDQVVLKQVMVQSVTVLKTMNAVVGRYVDAAKSVAAPVAGLVVDIAGRQRMLTQRMAKEAFLIGLNVERQANLANLAATAALFRESHEGIIGGTPYVNVGVLTNMCTLWQMRAVTAKWSEVEPFMMNIMDFEDADDATLEKIAVLNLVLLTEMAKAVTLYVQVGKGQQVTCDWAASIDSSSWSKLINQGGKQRMMGQKASRLFFQIARKIKVTDGRVALSTTLSSGGSSLQGLIEGSEKDNLPAPPTQALATKLTGLMAGWQSFSEMLTESSSSDAISSQVLLRVARLSLQTLTSMNEAVEMMVDECLIRMPAVNPVVINIAGRQRMLMQQMSKEALLVVLDQDVTENKQRVEATIKLWLDVHSTLLLGRQQTNTTTALSRTTDVCLLRQMKSAFDRFNDLMLVCHKVATQSTWLTNTEVDVMLEQINDMNDPAFAAMHTAVGMFASSQNTCELGQSLDQWQQVFLRMGRAELIIENVTLEYLLQAIGGIVLEDDSQDRRLQGEESEVEQVKVPSKMAAHIAEFDEMLFLLKYGNDTLSVSTPPSQQIADRLFNLTDTWENLKALLTTVVDRSKAEELLELSTQLSTVARHTMDLYEEQATLFNNQTSWKKIGRVNREPAELTRLVRDVALLSFTECQTCITQGRMLATSISTFDAVARPVDQENGQVTNAMENFVEKWDSLKPMLESVVVNYDEMQSVPEASLMGQIVLQSSLANTASARTVDVLISLTQTTTRIPLDILVPLPLTGAWDAGESMRAAILVAQHLINSEQKILPGYTLVSHFIDDECSDETIVQQVLEEKSANENLIALGGVGCQASCEAAARVAPSMRLPFLSYACPGPKLSDSSIFKNFARMGGTMVTTPEIVKALAERFNWQQVAVVVGDPMKYAEEGGYLQRELQNQGVNVEYMPEEKGNSFAQSRSLAEEIKSKKLRVLFMVGDESFKRRIVCASREVGANIGISWITEGAHSRGWLVQPDSSLPSECTAADMEESFDGAINIVDSDTPLAGQEELPLDCFNDETSRSFLELAARAAEEGFPAGDNTTASQKHFEVFAKAADGTCAMALTMGRLIDSGVEVEQLRNPSVLDYEQFHTSLRRDTAFRGASGPVVFAENDAVGHVLIRQRQRNADDETKDITPWIETTVGIQFSNGTQTLEMSGGPSDAAYKEAFQDVEEEFPFVTVQVSIVVLFICCPFCLGLCYVYRKHSGGKSAQTLKSDAKGRAEV